MSVCRDGYLNLVGRSPVDRLLDGRLRVGLLTTLGSPEGGEWMGREGVVFFSFFPIFYVYVQPLWVMTDLSVLYIHRYPSLGCCPLSLHFGLVSPLSFCNIWALPY